MIASNEVLDIATAVLFTITFVIGLYYSRFINTRRYRHVYLFVAFLSLVGLFSEIRLGLHPIIEKLLFYLGITNWWQFIAIISILSVPGLIVFIGYLHQFSDFKKWIICNIPTVIFLLGFGLFFLASIWLDTHNSGGKRSIVFLEELCELDMAVSLLFCVIYLRSIVHMLPQTSLTMPINLSQMKPR